MTKESRDRRLGGEGRPATVGEEGKIEIAWYIEVFHVQRSGSSRVTVAQAGAAVIHTVRADRPAVRRATRLDNKHELETKANHAWEVRRLPFGSLLHLLVTPGRGKSPAPFRHEGRRTAHLPRPRHANAGRQMPRLAKAKTPTVSQRRNVNGENHSPPPNLRERAGSCSLEKETSSADKRGSTEPPASSTRLTCSNKRAVSRLLVCLFVVASRPFVCSCVACVLSHLASTEDRDNRLTDENINTSVAAGVFILVNTDHYQPVCVALLHAHQVVEVVRHELRCPIASVPIEHPEQRR